MHGPARGAHSPTKQRRGSPTKRARPALGVPPSLEQLQREQQAQLAALQQQREMGSRAARTAASPARSGSAKPAASAASHSNASPSGAASRVREENARQLTTRYRQHEEVRQTMITDRERVQRELQLHKRDRQQEWRRKMERSPFHVDQLAESERIDEENRVRRNEDARRQRLMEARKSRIKQEIIIKVLSESMDRDSVRASRRTLLDDARRSKAQRDVLRAASRQQSDPLRRQEEERMSHNKQLVRGTIAAMTDAEMLRANEIKQRMLRAQLSSVSESVSKDQPESIGAF